MRHNNPATLLVASLVALFAGCLDAGPATTDGPRDAILPDETGGAPLATLTLEQCRGGILLGEVPSAWTQPLRPHGFEPLPTAFVLDDTRIIWRHCERAILDELVIGPFTTLEAGFVVRQELDAQREPQVMLALATFVSDPLIAQRLNKHNVSADHARFDVRWTPLGGDAKEVQFRASTDETTIQFPFLDLGSDQSRNRGEEDIWRAAPQIMRATMLRDEVVTGAPDADPIVVGLSGSGIINSLYGHQASWPHAQQARHDGFYTTTFHEVPIV